MKVLIVDKKLFREVGTSLKVSLTENRIKEELPEIKILPNIKDCIKYLSTEKNAPDIIMIDENIPFYFSFDVLRYSKRKTKFIFMIDNYEKFNSYHGYLSDHVSTFKEIHNVSFIAKPRDHEEFSEMIRKQFFPEKTSRENLIVQSNKQVIVLKIEQINRIESIGDYVKIYSQNDSFVVYSTLKGILTKLPSNRFTRVNRSCIVNVSYIRRVNCESVTLSNQVTLPLNKNKKRDLVSLVENYHQHNLALSKKTPLLSKF